MPALHVFGLDHAQTTLAIREQLALGPEEIQGLLPAVLDGGSDSQSSAAEAMVLSTCHRTELYLVLPEEEAQSVLSRFYRWIGLPQTLVASGAVYHGRDGQAARHLYAVAASLRSPVTGDTQIAQQIHGAMELARNAGTLGPLLQQLVEGALRAAKRVRRETGLMAGGGGIGPAVLHLLRHHHPGPRSVSRPLQVLLLGTGRMAAEVAAHLQPGAAGHGDSMQARDVRIAGIWGRSPGNTARFAAIHGTKAVSSPSVSHILGRVDAVVGACRGRVAGLSLERLGPVLETRITPLSVVDLGVPRNLDPQLAGRDGLLTISLDDVHSLLRARGRHRAASLGLAQRILEEEVARMDRRWREWPLRPMRAELYSTLETVLRRWHSDQPDAVRHLRNSIHRSLHEAFGSVLPSGIRPLPGTATNR